MYRKSTPTHRRVVTPLAADDDLVRDLMCDQLAHIEPVDISDLLDLADLVIDATSRRLDVQTVVTR